jgi:hypothetical protein
MSALIAPLQDKRQGKDMGFISDEEKLIILKQEMYRTARCGESTADLRRAIDCIQEAWTLKIERKILSILSYLVLVIA